MTASLPYVHQVTKYDPADRDERGYYVGDEDVRSDHRPVEAAYLAVAAAFAKDSGVTEVAIREPAVAGVVNFGVEPAVVLLEEGHVHNASRWHRVTAVGLASIRSGLAPRARLSIWPDLSPDAGAALADLPDGLTELVWSDQHGKIHSRYVYADEDDPMAVVGDSDGVLAVSCYADERRPLLAAVLPDADGVLRARWAA
ncbi:hypothetical protein AB0B66_13475 [Catellatospora sp. NPDC049111]|uniref:hypothetical protein n=1 Tax=Catellatospora sp. NPDC049111 TaxID=3155271 RepID=UPI0033EFADA2